jgi:hypothetical protein
VQRLCSFYRFNFYTLLVVAVFTSVLDRVERVGHNSKEFMRIFVPLKFIASIVLVLMLTMAIHVMHESAHAMQSHVTVASGYKSPSKIPTSHQSPCSPLEQNEDYDCCDICINCACHASLALQPFQLGYLPTILELSAYVPFKHHPEVYLPKFIPPQNLA